MDKTLEELKAEADVLGVEYSKNIGAAKLAEKVEAYYESQSAGDSVKVQAEPEVEAEVQVSKKSGDPIRDLVNKMRTDAFKKTIVTITSNDKRDSEYTTTAYLSMENQYFSIARIVPLDIPVELEECLINVAKTTQLIQHRDEIIDGRRTGNKTTVQVRAYNVSYENISK